MHGLGNDFILVDDPRAPLNAKVAIELCDRRFGIGADQILWLKPAQNPSQADARMEILNSDGSIAEMCGNGIRAVGLYLKKRGLSAVKPGQNLYKIETLAGLMCVEIHDDQVLVNMGPPVLGQGVQNKKGEELEVDGKKFTFFEVSMGNPHAVFFVDDLSQVDLSGLGPKIENHFRFPKRTNVEFVQVKAQSAIDVKVWERGAGITLACGTGACASAVATLATGRAAGRLSVGLPGGELKISWEGPGQPVLMEGPAAFVFDGETWI